MRPCASYQIRKIVVCACARNAVNVFLRRRLQRKPLVSDLGMHHGTCVTHMRDVCRDRLPAVAGKCSRHSRCMRTRNFTYLVRGPCHSANQEDWIPWHNRQTNLTNLTIIGKMWDMGQMNCGTCENGLFAISLRMITQTASFLMFRFLLICCKTPTYTMLAVLNNDTTLFIWCYVKQATIVCPLLWYLFFLQCSSPFSLLPK